MKKPVVYLIVLSFLMAYQNCSKIKFSKNEGGTNTAIGVSNNDDNNHPPIIPPPPQASPPPVPTPIPSPMPTPIPTPTPVARCHSNLPIVHMSPTAVGHVVNNVLSLTITDDNIGADYYRVAAILIGGIGGDLLTLCQEYPAANASANFSPCSNWTWGDTDEGHHAVKVKVTAYDQNDCIIGVGDYSYRVAPNGDLE